MFRLSTETTDNNIIFTKIIIRDELEITFSNLGASVYEIKFSDIEGNLENILITPPKKIWLANRTFAGSIIGPLAGRYEVGKTTLEKNRPPIHFHGGTKGWDRIIWNQKITTSFDKFTILFNYETLNYDAEVIYTVDKNAKLSMKINVWPKRKIYLNPTNHMYFNLNGSPFLDITNHYLQINAKSVFREKNGLIQSAFPEKVEPSLDLHRSRTLSFLPKTKGINHTYQFTEKRSGILQHPTNGRQVFFETTLPSVVIYTFNVEQSDFKKNNVSYPIYSGITFETQHPANNLYLVSYDSQHPYYSMTTYSFLIDLKDSNDK